MRATTTATSATTIVERKFHQMNLKKRSVFFSKTTTKKRNRKGKPASKKNNRRRFIYIVCVSVCVLSCLALLWPLFYLALTCRIKTITIWHNTTNLFSLSLHMSIIISSCIQLKFILFVFFSLSLARSLPSCRRCVLICCCCCCCFTVLSILAHTHTHHQSTTCTASVFSFFFPLDFQHWFKILSILLNFWAFSLREEKKKEQRIETVYSARSCSFYQSIA